MEALIDSSVSAILNVHLWERPAHIDELSSMAQRAGLNLIFDAAHALGSSYRKRMIGGFGDAEVFSFHATEVARQNYEPCETSASPITTWSPGFGINEKMHEMSAAMGLTCLESMDRFVRINRRNWNRYRDELDGLPGVTLLPIDSTEESNYHYVVLVVDVDAQINRDTLIAILWKENVLARRYFFPGIERMEPYCSGFEPVGLPVTNDLAHRVLCLPNGTVMNESEISQVASLIEFAFANANEINSRLAKARSSAGSLEEINGVTSRMS